MKIKCSVVLIIALCICAFSASAGYYHDAYASYKAKNYDEAIQILEEGLAAAPNDEDLAKLLGQVYFKVKQVAKAEKAFQKTVNLNPDDHLAQYYLGVCLTLRRENGKPKPAWFEASQSFAKAVELMPTSDKYNYQLGHSLLMLRKFQQAQAPLETAYATEKGKGDYKIATDLGVVYQSMKLNAQAIEMFEKAILLNPKKDTPYQYLGSLYLSEKNYQKVQELGEKLIEMNPDEAKGYSFRGYGQLMEKKWSDAESTFTKAIELDPTDPSFYYQRGLAREGKIGTSAHSYKSLIDDYAKAISLSDSEVQSEWHYRLGHAYELQATLYWDRAFRHAESCSNCLRNLRKAKTEYVAAGENADAARQLAVVNERIRQLEVIR